jgi:hypothetical protein
MSDIKTETKITFLFLKAIIMSLMKCLQVVFDLSWLSTVELSSIETSNSSIFFIYNNNSINNNSNSSYNYCINKKKKLRIAKLELY